MEENKALVRQLIDDVISNGNFARLEELLSPAYVYHAPGMEVSGPEGLRQLLTMLRTAFPDWHETTEDLFAEADKVVFRVVGQGTQHGESMGIPPTSNAVTMHGTDIVRIEGRKLVEHWAVFDQLGLLQQLGVVPASEQSALDSP